MPSKIDCAPLSFVSQIVKDPAKPPATLLLRGFMGDSTDSEHIRIYLDAELSRFIDAPKSAILHMEPVPIQHSALGGHMVWVHRDAPLRRNPAATGATAFLEGGLTAFPAGQPPRGKQASRRPMEGITDTCSPPPTEDASCATSLQQSTCVPETQPGACYAPELPRGGGEWLGTSSGSWMRGMISEETAEGCQA